MSKQRNTHNNTQRHKTRKQLDKVENKKDQHQNANTHYSTNEQKQNPNTTQQQHIIQKKQTKKT